MNYNKYKRIGVHKKLAGLIKRDIPHRKNVLRKLTTIITREEKNKLNSPINYSKNKVSRR